MTGAVVIGTAAMGQPGPPASPSATTGTIIPPAAAAIYWETVATWWSANYSSGVRFDVEVAKTVRSARLPCTVASGNIEVAIHRVVPKTGGGWLGVEVVSSGVIACPSPSNGAITVSFTADTALEPGQYVATLWCSNTTATFIHNSSTGVLRAGVAMSFDAELTAGLPLVGDLAYSGRAVAIVIEEAPDEVGEVVLLGDSIVQQQKWFTAATALAGALYDTTNEGNAGETSTQIAARVAADVVAAAPDLCVVLAGTNDIGETTPVAATIIANLSAIISACTTAGIDVIIGTIPPRFNTGVGDDLTTVQRTALTTVNAWIRQQASGTTVQVADWTVELSTGDGIEPDTAYFTDHVHPNQAGAYVMAGVLAELLAPADAAGPGIPGPRGLQGSAGPAGANGSNGTNGSNGDWSTAQTIRAVTGTTDTPTASDAGKFVTLSNASAITVTINGSLDLAAGQRIDFAQTGAGQVTFSASGATVNGTPGLKTRAQYSACTLFCTAADTYLLLGDLSA